MRPLPKPRETPKGSRYFDVKTAKGAHHFRLPTYGVAASLLRWAEEQERSAGLRPAEGEEPVGEWDGQVATRERVSAAVLGTCWFHRGMEVEAIRADLTWDAFADAVAEELVDADYTFGECRDLAATVRARLVRFYNDGVAIKEEARAEGKD